MRAVKPSKSLHLSRFWARKIFFRTCYFFCGFDLFLDFGVVCGLARGFFFRSPSSFSDLLFSTHFRAGGHFFHRNAILLKIPITAQLARALGGKHFAKGISHDPSRPSSWDTLLQLHWTDLKYSVMGGVYKPARAIQPARRGTFY